LRKAAKYAANTSRQESILEYELNHLTKRLAELNGQLIGKSWPEKGNYRWINDPGAYSHQINRDIEEKQKPEREFLETRIAEVEASLAEAREHDSSQG